MRTDACKMAGPARRRLTGLLVGACVLVGPIAGLPGSVDASAFPAETVATLSNLKTVTRWAYPQEPAVAHRYPSARSRVVGRLRFLTSQGQPEVYLALRSYTVGATSWIEVPLPGRPNGLTGWVAAGALGEMHITREYLRVDRETMRATLYRDRHAIWNAPVGVGRPSLPTPAGHFYVMEKLAVIDGPIYGPYAIGTSAYAPTLSEWPGGGVVGIHGTDEPQLIPGRPSHGCIRLRNADVVSLWHLIQVGTPIEIV
ncbi:MAG TPA: L,D-transpeptidase [Solirubrobacteraceae bacterium]|nr:L,D-transpeptidase [Solirubrobacteraceae bacterium]